MWWTKSSCNLVQRCGTILCDLCADDVFQQCVSRSAGTIEFDDGLETTEETDRCILCQGTREEARPVVAKFENHQF